MRQQIKQSRKPNWFLKATRIQIADYSGLEVVKYRVIYFGLESLKLPSAKGSTGIMSHYEPLEARSS